MWIQTEDFIELAEKQDQRTEAILADLDRKFAEAIAEVEAGLDRPVKQDQAA